VLPILVVAIVSKSTSLTFGWALSYRGMMLAFDGFYCNQNGVSCRHHEVAQQHIFE